MASRIYVRLNIQNMLRLSHKGLEVYKMAMLYLKEVYTLTKSFPKEEQFALINQIRRAAVSVCSNIAEGASRISVIEKKRFYEISRSSLVEADTHFEISLLLNYVQQIQLGKLDECQESIFRMLSKMISNLTK